MILPYHRRTQNSPSDLFGPSWIDAKLAQGTMHIILDRFKSRTERVVCDRPAVSPLHQLITCNPISRTDHFHLRTGGASGSTDEITFYHGADGCRLKSFGIDPNAGRESDQTQGKPILNDCWTDASHLRSGPSKCEAPWY